MNLSLYKGIKLRWVSLGTIPFLASQQVPKVFAMGRVSFI